MPIIGVVAGNISSLLVIIPLNIKQGNQGRFLFLSLPSRPHHYREHIIFIMVVTLMIMATRSQSGLDREALTYNHRRRHSPSCLHSKGFLKQSTANADVFIFIIIIAIIISSSPVIIIGMMMLLMMMIKVSIIIIYLPPVCIPKKMSSSSSL